MELHTLFNGYIYGDLRQPREQPRHWHFWLPLIAYYSGAYSDEIGHLTLEDIVTLNKVPCLHFHTHGKLNARRVPLHPHLLSVGFYDYLEKVKSLGENRLLFDLPAKTGRYSEKVRIWFSGEGERAGYMQKCALPTVDHEGMKTAISSLRLNFEQQLRIAAMQSGSKEAFNYLMGFKEYPHERAPDVQLLAELVAKQRVVNASISWQRFIERH